MCCDCQTLPCGHGTVRKKNVKHFIITPLHLVLKEHRLSLTIASMADMHPGPHMIYYINDFWVGSLLARQPRLCRVITQVPFRDETDVYRFILQSRRGCNRILHNIRKVFRRRRAPALLTHELISYPMILWPGITRATLQYHAYRRLSEPRYNSRPSIPNP